MKKILVTSYLIFLSISIYLSIYLPIYQSIYIVRFGCLNCFVYRKQCQRVTPVLEKDTLSSYLSIYPSMVSILYSQSKYTYISNYLSIYLFIYLSINLCIHLSIYQSMYLSIYLSIYLPIYLPIYLSLLGRCLRLVGAEGWPPSLRPSSTRSTFSSSSVRLRLINISLSFIFWCTHRESQRA